MSDASQQHYPFTTWEHWIFLLMSAVVIVLSFVMTRTGEEVVHFPGTQTPMPEICLTKSRTGLPCPGCGLTRAFISLGHGEIAQAWKFNRGSLALFLFVFGQIPWQANQIWRIKTGKQPIHNTLLLIIPCVVAAQLVFFWLYRVSGFFA